VQPFGVQVFPRPGSVRAAVPRSTLREGKELVNRSLCAVAGGVPLQFAAQHRIDRRALVGGPNASAVQDGVIDSYGEVRHGISVIRDQCWLGGPDRGDGEDLNSRR